MTLRTDSLRVALQARSLDVDAADVPAQDGQ